MTSRVNQQEKEQDYPVNQQEKEQDYPGYNSRKDYPGYNSRNGYPGYHRSRTTRVTTGAGLPGLQRWYNSPGYNGGITARVQQE